MDRRGDRARLAKETSPVCARVTTDAGCQLYAFNWEPLEPDLAWFVGVHCFPGEPVDLDRQQRFVITDARGHAAIMLADAYLDALEHQKTAFALHAYGIAFESAPDLPQA
jgi:hypothetical protein